jgi:hypothetical protein
MREIWKSAFACAHSPPASIASASELSASCAAASQSRRSWWQRERQLRTSAANAGSRRDDRAFVSSDRVKRVAAAGTSACFSLTQPMRKRTAARSAASKDGDWTIRSA